MVGFQKPFLRDVSNVHLPHVYCSQNAKKQYRCSSSPALNEGERNISAAKDPQAHSIKTFSFQQTTFYFSPAFFILLYFFACWDREGGSQSTSST